MALFDELRSFLAEVETQQVKAASSKKRAEANTEAGSYEGGTSHPVKSVDDQTGDAHEGARSTENSADVKEQVPGGGVDSASEKTPDQEGQQYDVGITSHATGEDPANEGDYKGTKDDPGTSHPAKTEDGEKYSSMSFAKLKGLVEKKANALIANIAVALKEAELHGDQDKLDVEPKDGKITGSDLKALRAGKGKTTHGVTDEKKAAAVGYDQAVQSGIPSQETDLSFFKEASENMLRGALTAATATGQYLTAFNNRLATKLAEESEEHEAEEPAGHEESESPKQEAAEEAGGDLGLDEGDMAAMAGGGEGGDAGSIDELLAALAEMGVSPDEVMAALGGAEGGAPAGDVLPPEAMGGDMMAGGEAPKMAAANKQTLKLMKAAKARARSGKFQISAAKTAGQRQLRNEIKKCIAEIVG
jgi:hypothetical protein